MFQVHKEIRVAVFPKEVDFSAATTLNSSVPKRAFSGIAGKSFDRMNRIVRMEESPPKSPAFLNFVHSVNLKT